MSGCWLALLLSTACFSWLLFLITPLNVEIAVQVVVYVVTGIFLFKTFVPGNPVGSLRTVRLL